MNYFSNPTHTQSVNINTHVNSKQGHSIMILFVWLNVMWHASQGSQYICKPCFGFIKLCQDLDGVKMADSFLEGDRKDFQLRVKGERGKTRQTPQIIPSWSSNNPFSLKYPQGYTQNMLINSFDVYHNKVTGGWLVFHWLFGNAVKYNWMRD